MTALGQNDVSSPATVIDDEDADEQLPGSLGRLCLSQSEDTVLPLVAVENPYATDTLPSRPAGVSSVDLVAFFRPV